MTDVRFNIGKLGLTGNDLGAGETIGIATAFWTKLPAAMPNPDHRRLYSKLCLAVTDALGIGRVVIRELATWDAQSPMKVRTVLAALERDGWIWTCGGYSDPKAAAIDVVIPDLFALNVRKESQTVKAVSRALRGVAEFEGVRRIRALLQGTPSPSPNPSPPTTTPAPPESAAGGGGGDGKEKRSTLQNAHYKLALFHDGKRVKWWVQEDHDLLVAAGHRFTEAEAQELRSRGIAVSDAAGPVLEPIGYPFWHEDCVEYRPRAGERWLYNPATGDWDCCRNGDREMGCTDDMAYRAGVRTELVHTFCADTDVVRLRREEEGDRLAKELGL